MHLKLSDFDNLITEGFIKRTEKGNLVLLNYTDKCTFDKNWNDLTEMCRGLIIEKNTGRVVGLPLKKFFNLNETEKTLIHKLPKLSYTISEKMDGSLGIIYYYEDKWNVATRGSFNSDQAIEATKMLEMYDLSKVQDNLTLLVEIIYPENKIIVNYGDQKRLVLLTIIDTITGEELPESTKEISKLIDMDLVPYHEISIEEAISKQSTLTKDQEGFVVRFKNGLRVKIKGDEYMKVARIIAHLSPLSCWESMTEGKVNKDYLMQLPEELRNEFTPIVEKLENKYSDVANEIEIDYSNLPIKGTSREEKKQIALFLNSASTIKHKAAMFSKLSGKSIDSYIMDQIRPHGNVL